MQSVMLTLLRPWLARFAAIGKLSDLKDADPEGIGDAAARCRMGSSALTALDERDGLLRHPGALGQLHLRQPRRHAQRA